MTSSESPEPPGSASSSPDEKCRCGHTRSIHTSIAPGACNACPGDEERSWRHAFVPAEPEASTAAQGADEPDDLHRWKRCVCGHPQHSSMCRVGGTLNFCGCLKVTSREDIAATCRRAGGCSEHPAEPEADEPCLTQSPEGLCAGTRRHPGDCTPNADDIALPEPEAHEHDWSEWGAVYHGLAKQWRKCAGCTATESRPEPEALVCSHDDWERDAQDLPQRCRDCGFEPESPGSPPRRPAYAVAYATKDGVLYEIALPGDATIRAENGALIITHASAIAALTQARPMEN